MGTYFNQKDLQTLRELRATLLGMERRPEGEAAKRYWASSRTLELYDRVFAARIGWKWEAVLDDKSNTVHLLITFISIRGNK